MSQVYGLHAVMALVESDPGRVRVIHVQRGRRDERMQALVEAARGRGIRVEAAERAWLDRRCPGSHQGVVADCHALTPLTDKDFEARFETLPRPHLLLVLDGVTDPRNLGAALRSAGAFGAHGLLVPERRSAGVTAAAWKVSAGAAARVPVARATNLVRALEDYRKAGLFIVGLDADGDAALDTLPFAGDPLVLVVGSEGKGLSRLVAERCDAIASIPMSATTESLNAGVATGIALYEVARLRRSEG